MKKYLPVPASYSPDYYKLEEIKEVNKQIFQYNYKVFENVFLNIKEEFDQVKEDLLSKLERSKIKIDTSSPQSSGDPQFCSLVIPVTFHSHHRLNINKIKTKITIDKNNNIISFNDNENKNWEIKFEQKGIENLLGRIPSYIKYKEKVIATINSTLDKNIFNYEDFKNNFIEKISDRRDDYHIINTSKYIITDLFSRDLFDVGLNGCYKPEKPSICIDLYTNIAVENYPLRKELNINRNKAEWGYKPKEGYYHYVNGNGRPSYDKPTYEFGYVISKPSLLKDLLIDNLAQVKDLFNGIITVFTSKLDPVGYIAQLPFEILLDITNEASSEKKILDTQKQENSISGFEKTINIFNDKIDFIAFNMNKLNNMCDSLAINLDILCYKMMYMESCLHPMPQETASSTSPETMSLNEFEIINTDSTDISGDCITNDYA